VSLILTGLIVAGTSGALALGRWIVKRRQAAAKGPKPQDPTEKKLETKKEPIDRAWLAGGVVLSEEMPVAALFVAPDAGQDCAIYVCPHPRESVAWLAPLDPGAILVGGEPPSAVEHDGIRFERVRRLPLRPRRIGVGAPDVGDTVLVAEYASTGSERLLLVKGSSGDTRAYRGHELEPHAFEVIASGRTTLD
jgi:hypothetical protein